jgi:hypothetical protein
MERQPAGMFRRPSGYADDAAAKASGHSDRVSHNNARQENAVPTHFEFVTSQVIGLDADGILNHAVKIIRQLDVSPDRPTDADRLPEGKPGGSLDWWRFQGIAGMPLIFGSEFRLDFDSRLTGNFEVGSVAQSIAQVR